MSSSGVNGLRGAHLLWLLPPTIVAVVVRFWNLSVQVAGGDEMHAVRSALAIPLEKLLVTYRPSDNCIPLTSLYRWVMDLGATPSELQMRAPILLAALGFAVVAPLVVAYRSGYRAAVAFAWMAALLPILVFYSRLIRSYLPIVFFGFVAVMAFEHWTRTASRRSAALYVVFGALACWFHLVAAPFVAVPFVYVGVSKLLDAKLGPSWRQIIVLGSTTVGALLLFLIPSRESLLRLISLKHESLEMTWGTWVGYFTLQAGGGPSVQIWIFWLLVAKGLVSCFLPGGDRRLGAFLATLWVGQVVGLYILSPLAMHQATIFNRYLLIATPCVLWLLALGLTGRWLPERAGRRVERALAVGLSTVFIAWTVWSGPLLHPDFLRTPFSQRPEVLLFHFGRTQPTVDKVQRAMPRAYAWIARRDDGELPIVEYPWHTTWRYSPHLIAYQRAHGRRVIVLPGERLLWDERLGFENLVGGKPRQILDSQAGWLMIHRSSVTEASRFDTRRVVPPDSGLGRDLARRQVDLEAFDRQIEQRLPGFEKAFGPPDFDDGEVAVWNLDRVRRKRGLPVLYPNVTAGTPET